MNTDGLDQRVLTSNQHWATHVYMPRWSPDGTRIAFDERVPFDGPTQLWIMDADGSNRRNVINAGESGRPELDGVTWSPDGTRIVFPLWSYSEQQFDLYQFDVENPWATLRELTDTPDVSEWEPAWGTSGLIAYISAPKQADAIGTWDLNVMTPDGSQRRLVHHSSRNADAPDWAPDGQRIAFARVAKRGNGDIYTVRPDGHGLRRLTSKGGGNPAYSPDGRWIAFDSNRKPLSAIFIMRSDGKRERLLMHRLEGGTQAWPDWQPR